MRRIFSIAAMLVVSLLLVIGCGSNQGETTNTLPATNANSNNDNTNVNVTENVSSPTAPTQEISVPGQTATADNLTAANFAVGLQQVASGFVHPLVFTHAKDNSGRMFVADQIGVIYVMAPDGSVAMNSPFLDLRDRMIELIPDYDERGLLGLAFHPDFANNGRFFVYYSAPGGSGDHTSHVSEFHVSGDDPNRADPASEKVILQIEEPQPNHNGGQITFGPDGYLYIPLGDGGGADDTDPGHVSDWYDVNAGGNGQDTQQNWLGSILRIDVNSGDPYAIPSDNPTPPGGNSPTEQWAWGFRNPYRISFDSGGDHWLYAGDAGQNMWEEVDVVQAGGNYGWNVREGAHCFNASNHNADLPNCPTADPQGNPLIDPVLEFMNLNQSGGLGLTMIGGNVYRGSAIPALSGKYVFASWSSSWSATAGQLLVATPGPLNSGLWMTYALPR